MIPGKLYLAIKVNLEPQHCLKDRKTEVLYSICEEEWKTLYIEVIVFFALLRMGLLEALVTLFLISMRGKFTPALIMRFQAQIMIRFYIIILRKFYKIKDKANFFALLYFFYFLFIFLFIFFSIFCFVFQPQNMLAICLNF